MPVRRGRGRAARPLRLEFNKRLQRSECIGSLEYQLGGNHRQPHPRPRTSQHPRAGLRSAGMRVAVNSRRKEGRSSGSTSPTTSTSPCGARRVRTAPPTSRRAARWRSRVALTGVSGRRRTASEAAVDRDHRGDRPVPRLPRRVGRSGRWERQTATASRRRPMSRPTTPTSSPPGATAGGGGSSGDDDIPF